MAASPPLPSSGIQFPLGVSVNTPVSPFAPDLQKKLEEARKNGRYLITVTIEDPAEPGRLLCFVSRSKAFKEDYLLRAWKTICRMFISVDPEIKTAPAPPETVSSVSGSDQPPE